MGSFISGIASLVFVVVIIEGLCNTKVEHVKLGRRPPILYMIKDSQITNNTSILLDAPYR
jgi:hypothetical protein